MALNQHDYGHSGVPQQRSFDDFSPRSAGSSNTPRSGKSRCWSLVLN